MIGILYHPKIARAQPLSAEIASWLESRGESVWIGSLWDDADQHATHIDGMSLMIVLGGDGSTLRAARLAAPFDVPIFSINLGWLGFLSEAWPDNWQEKLSRVLAGEYWLERRLMLQAVAERNGELLGRQTALNDVVVGRGAQARILRVNLTINDDFITQYAADGVIAATPTGSTAYALAAGGPILPPQGENILLVPVAPHLSFNRSLVLHPDTVVTLEVVRGFETAFSADGASAVALENGDKVTITKGPHQSCFARVDAPSYFYRRLMGGLGLVENGEL